MPLAIGAKVARPDKRSLRLSVTRFAHSWAELETMMRMKLPVAIVVLNNGILGFQRDAETVKFGNFTSACPLPRWDHAKLAEACGCPAVRVEDPSELADTCSVAWTRGRY